jgi:hypothetical protein
MSFKNTNNPLYIFHSNVYDMTEHVGVIIMGMDFLRIITEDHTALHTDYNKVGGIAQHSMQEVETLLNEIDTKINPEQSIHLQFQQHIQNHLFPLLKSLHDDINYFIEENNNPILDHTGFLKIIQAILKLCDSIISILDSYQRQVVE